VRDLVEDFEKKVIKPRKLSDELHLLKQSRRISNLQVMSKPYTKAAKDRELGRGKIIEAALRERGLLGNVKQQPFRL
jgi:hypothetical protein